MKVLLLLLLAFVAFWYAVATTPPPPDFADWMARQARWRAVCTGVVGTQSPDAHSCAYQLGLLMREAEDKGWHQVKIRP